MTIKGKMTPTITIIALPIKPILLYAPFSAKSAKMNPIAEAITPLNRKLSLPKSITTQHTNPTTNKIVDIIPDTFFVYLNLHIINFDNI